MKMKAILAGLVLALGMGAAAQAATFNLIFQSNGRPAPGINECAGDFGNPPNCTYVSADNYYSVGGGAGPDATSSSYNSGDFGSLTMIAKVDNPFSSPSFTSGTLSATLGNFSFSVVGSLLQWTYTPGSSLATIFAFSVKGGPRYNLYEIAIAPTNSGSTEVVSGWVSPQGGTTDAISHITFFGKDLPAPPPPPPPPVPLPAAGLLLLGALGGLGLMRRRAAA